jgi:hypothetical protein
LIISCISNEGEDEAYAVLKTEAAEKALASKSKNKENTIIDKLKRMISFDMCLNKE